MYMEKLTNAKLKDLIRKHKSTSCPPYSKLNKKGLIEVIKKLGLKMKGDMPDEPKPKPEKKKPEKKEPEKKEPEKKKKEWYEVAQEAVAAKQKKRYIAILEKELKKVKKKYIMDSDANWNADKQKKNDEIEEKIEEINDNLKTLNRILKVEPQKLVPVHVRAFVKKFS